MPHKYNLKLMESNVDDDDNGSDNLWQYIDRKRSSADPRIDIYTLFTHGIFSHRKTQSR